MQNLHWKYNALNKKLVLLGIFVSLMLGLLYAHMTAAATYTWDNDGGDGLWSTCANWSSDVCPGSGDIATFDGSTTTDSVIDASFAGSVAGIDINSGYTGTITQERNMTIGSTGFDQAAGTFIQGTTTFDINNAGFVLSAGTFETGQGTSTIEKDVTLSGGTYTASSSSVITFNPNHHSEDPTLTCTGQMGGLIKIAGTANGNSVFTLAAGCEASTTESTFNNSSITNNGILHFGTSVNLDGYGTFTNNGTTTFSGTDFYTENSFTQNGIFDLTGKTIRFNSNHHAEDMTVTCTGQLGGLISIQGTGGVNSIFTLVSGCEATTTASTVQTASLVNNGILHFGTSIDFNGVMTFTNNGTSTFDGSDIYSEGSFLQNGIFDLTGVTVHLNPNHYLEDPTVSCTGELGGLLQIASTGGSGSVFTLTSGCSAVATTSSGTGSLSIAGTLTLAGTSLTGTSITVVDGGVLRLTNTETITTPSLVSGSTVEYYGSGTYASLAAGASVDSIIFSAGTYNLATDLNIFGDFTNSGATFNQTTGTTTFLGTSNIISGNNTFYNLAKQATTTSSLYFTAGDTQTISNTLTLTGTSSAQRLTVTGYGQGDWNFDPQGTRNVNYLMVTNGNNLNTLLLNCYDVDCVDGGGNTNIYFTQPLPTYRLRGGLRFSGGVRL